VAVQQHNSNLYSSIAMTAKEINELSPVEIDTKVRESREQLLQLRLRKQTGQVEKTHELRSLRKDIARLLTAAKAKKSVKAA
jgi:large subunit ribosomal protein L29